MNVGGPARHALLLAQGLTTDYDTTLAAGRPTEAEGELSDPSVPVHHVPLVRPLDPVSDLRALAAVRRLLTACQPTILHTHMAKAGTVGRVVARSMRHRPLTVHTFHGHVLDGYFTPHVQRAFVEAERRLAHHTDALVAVSDEIRDELLDLGIGSPGRFHVIPLGLDLDPYFEVDQARGRLRARLGLAPDTPLIGIIGRLVPIKDVATMLRVTELLPGAHLAVIGDGELRAALEALARNLGLARRVHFTGWWHDVPGALSDLDLVVLTSRNEGTPVALIEAAAAARAVVATDVGGVRSVVVDGVTGHLAPAGDVEKIAGLVATLVSDPRGRRALGNAGRAYVRDRFGDKGLLQNVSALYADLRTGAGY
jgi:glycosyltransferase involved in cell wall biosynthesis